MMGRFHEAAFRGDIVALTIALDGGQLDPCHKDSTGTSVLHKTAANGHLDCLQILAERGGDLSQRDVTGCTPLHAAARNGHMKTVKWLVNQGCDIHAQSTKGNTALDVAKSRSHGPVVKYLRECGRERFDWELTMEEQAMKGQL